MRRRLPLALLAVFVVAIHAGQEPRPPGARSGDVPEDVRLGPLRDLDTHAPFEPPSSAEAWGVRAQQLRRQVRLALGLWPWPTRTPLVPRIHRRVEREGYVIEAVAFESVPGHSVTGSLYRPAGRTGRLPAVLSPHGHWPGGRFQVVGDDDVRAALASGAEPFESAARHPLQARAVHLARMGALVFFLDMEGYADSQQIPEAVAHGFRAPRPHMHGPGTWGFFSPQAELHLQSIMGLQTWNIIRALDYVASRDDVDPNRIGVTGASGGGTQTFVLAALDERPAAFFPAVMVSTRMQGGCTCENASYLRTGTNNVEIAALAAPRPLGLTAADDWTRDLERDGFPALQRVFALLGAPSHVALRTFPQFGHNYNGPARAVMYEWFNRHLRLGWDEVPAERPFVPLTRAEATVGPLAGSASSGEAHERALLAWLRDDSARRLAAATPGAGGTLATFQEVVGGAVHAIVGRDLPPAGSVDFDERRRDTDAHGTVTQGLLRLRAEGEALPTTLWSAAGPAKGIVVWPHVDGRSALEGGEHAEAIARLRIAGYEVLGLDTLMQGALGGGRTPTGHTRLASTRAHAGYTYGYNHPLPVARTHDVLTAVRFARDRAGSGEVVLAGAGAAAGWAAAARAVAGAAVDRLIVEPAGFRFAGVSGIDHPDFLPGAAKYGDLPALLALSAPHRTQVLADSSGDLHLAEAVYRVVGQQAMLHLEQAGGPDAMVSGVLRTAR